MGSYLGLIQFRRATSADWVEEPILLKGEMGLDTTLMRAKLGDGVTPWIDLPWVGEPGAAGPEGPEGPQGLQGPQGPQGPQGVNAIGGGLGEDPADEGVFLVLDSSTIQEDPSDEGVFIINGGEA